MDELAMAEDALRAVLDAGCTGLGGAEQVARLHAVERCRRLLDAIDVDTIAALDADRTSEDFGRPSTTDLLAVELLTTPADASTRVWRARALGPRRELTGAPLPPLLPATAAALRAGSLTGPQSTVVIRTLERIPDDIASEACGPIETLLLEAAQYEDARRLRQTADLALARLDPDGREPCDDAFDDRRRRYDLTRLADGSFRSSGRLAPEIGVALRTVLDALSAPRPAEGGEPDDRIATQRRHDALGEVAQRLLRSGTLPDCGGTPVTVLVRTTERDLADPAGVVTTDRGETLSVERLRRLGDEVAVIPVTFDRTGAVLACGRENRLASRAQRRALAARDGGCSFPGCSRPASWCQVNHVVRWEHGGATDLDNLHLLCAYHHREYLRRGWEVRMVDGVPEWLPPPWVDPDRRPRRNTAHHLRELVLS